MDSLSQADEFLETSTDAVVKEDIENSPKDMSRLEINKQDNISMDVSMINPTKRNNMSLLMPQNMEPIQMEKDTFFELDSVLDGLDANIGMKLIRNESHKYFILYESQTANASPNETKIPKLNQEGVQNFAQFLTKANIKQLICQGFDGDFAKSLWLADIYLNTNLQTFILQEESFKKIESFILVLYSVEQIKSGDALKIALVLKAPPCHSNERNCDSNPVVFLSQYMADLCPKIFISVGEPIASEPEGKPNAFRKARPSEQPKTDENPKVPLTSEEIDFFNKAIKDSKLKTQPGVNLKNKSLIDKKVLSKVTPKLLPKVSDNSNYLYQVGTMRGDDDNPIMVSKLVNLKLLYRIKNPTFEIDDFGHKTSDELFEMITQVTCSSGKETSELISSLPEIFCQFMDPEKITNFKDWIFTYKKKTSEEISKKEGENLENLKNCFGELMTLIGEDRHDYCDVLAFKSLQNLPVESAEKLTNVTISSQKTEQFLSELKELEKSVGGSNFEQIEPIIDKFCCDRNKCQKLLEFGEKIKIFSSLPQFNNLLRNCHISWNSSKESQLNSIIQKATESENELSQFYQDKADIAVEECKSNILEVRRILRTFEINFFEMSITDTKKVLFNKKEFKLQLQIHNESIDGQIFHDFQPALKKIVFTSKSTGLIIVQINLRETNVYKFKIPQEQVSGSSIEPKLFCNWNYPDYLISVDKEMKNWILICPEENKFHLGLIDEFGDLISTEVRLLSNSQADLEEFKKNGYLFKNTLNQTVLLPHAQRMYFLGASDGLACLDYQTGQIFKLDFGKIIEEKEGARLTVTKDERHLLLKVKNKVFIFDVKKMTLSDFEDVSDISEFKLIEFGGAEWLVTQGKNDELRVYELPPFLDSAVDPKPVGKGQTETDFPALKWYKYAFKSLGTACLNKELILLCQDQEFEDGVRWWDTTGLSASASKVGHESFSFEDLTTRLNKDESTKFLHQYNKSILIDESMFISIAFTRTPWQLSFIENGELQFLTSNNTYESANESSIFENRVFDQLEGFNLQLPDKNIIKPKSKTMVIGFFGEQNIDRPSLANYLFQTRLTLSGSSFSDGIWISFCYEQNTEFVILNYEGFWSQRSKSQKLKSLLAILLRACDIVVFHTNLALLDEGDFEILTLGQQLTETHKKSAYVLVCPSGSQDTVSSFKTKLAGYIKPSEIDPNTIKNHIRLIDPDVLQNRASLTSYITNQLKITQNRWKNFNQFISHLSFGFLQAKNNNLSINSCLDDIDQLLLKFIQNQANEAFTAENESAFEEKLFLYQNTKLTEPVTIYHSEVGIDNKDDLFGTIANREFDKILEKSFDKKYTEKGLKNKIIVAEVKKELKLKFYEDRIKALLEYSASQLQKYIDNELIDERQKEKLLSKLGENLRRYFVLGNFCERSCSVCDQPCMLRNSHKKACSCRTNHLCGANCLGSEYCKKMSKRCSLISGHNSDHNCNESNHNCQENCQILSCSRVCGLNVGHSKDFKHDCKQKHECQKQCRVEGCGLRCQLNPEDGHKNHACEKAVCESICHHCEKQCKVSDHFHEEKIQSGVFAEFRIPDVHDCGGLHPCKKVCPIDGFCAIEYKESKQSVATPKGKVLVSKTNGFAYKKNCAKSFSISDPNHEHKCGQNDHFCGKPCPQCLSPCTEKYGHTGLHKTDKHCNIDSKVYAGLNAKSTFQIKMDDTEVELTNGLSAVFETCAQNCDRLGRGHIHLTPCGLGDRCNRNLHKSFQHVRRPIFASESTTCDRQSCPDFWKSKEWVCPLPSNKLALVESCSFECTHLNHLTISGGLPERSFCNKKSGHSFSNDRKDHNFTCTTHFLKSSKMDIIFCYNPSSLTQSIKSRLFQLINDLSSQLQGKLTQFAFVSYSKHQFGAESYEQESCIKKIDFTNDRNSLFDKFESSKLVAQNDSRDAVYDGLFACTTLEFRPDAERIVYHLADTPPYGSEYGADDEDHFPEGCPCGLSIDSLAQEFEKKNIQYCLIQIGNQVSQMARVFRKTFGKLYTDSYIECELPIPNFVEEDGCQEYLTQGFLV